MQKSFSTQTALFISESDIDHPILLRPQPTFGQHISVVGGDIHDSVVNQFGFFQRFNNLACLSIEIRSIGVIGVASVAHFLICDCISTCINPVHYALREWIKLLVIVDLKCSSGYPGFVYDIHVRKSFINSFVELLVVQRPGEISWIDISDRPVFEAVQLIGPDKVHLSGQGGFVPHRT